MKRTQVAPFVLFAWEVPVDGYRWIRGQQVSTPVENLTDSPDENLTDRRGDEPQDVATS